MELEPLYPSPSEPYEVAKAFNVHATGAPIRHWRSNFYIWQDGKRWAPYADNSVRADLYGHLSRKFYRRQAKAVPWQPTKSKIDNVMDALAAAVAYPDTNEPERLHAIPLRNGWLDTRTRKLTNLTPERFNLHYVPIDYDPDAPQPERWLLFLKQATGGDTDAVKLLQEWAGYVLSGRTDMQKMMFCIGPKRSGKGTTQRVLKALIGSENVAAPMLGDFGARFGLQNLIGKTLAVVGDARLDKISATTTERLLSITGEDAITIDVKNQTPWSGQLPIRIMMASNELPVFADSSGALANRFLIVKFSKSAFGNENPNLFAELCEELPGILLWALDGLDRLNREGRFTIPTSAAAAVEQMEQAMSPEKVFGEECCEFSPEFEVEKQSLYDAYRAWCVRNGRKELDEARFGMKLVAAYPDVDPTGRRRVAGRRVRFYRGIQLRRP